ncbi:MAG: c-type cytochrome [Proteobacteria bacterium]|nr:c-type cytochrome [Pseudomonadota bacterium]
MTNISFPRVKTLIIISCIILGMGFGIFSMIPTPHQANSPISLMPKNPTVINNGKILYENYCAACHGKKLEGQPNWRQRDEDGYLPAPPHNKDGHTWHHPDAYLFAMTKYGIEAMIGRTYPNNMPAYVEKLSDEDIIAILSYIKSTWPENIQFQHDQINAQVSTQ